VLAALADGEPCRDLLFGGLRHPGGHVIGGRGGEVCGSCQKRNAGPMRLLNNGVALLMIANALPHMWRSLIR
jgi:hypothetical protein